MVSGVEAGIIQEGMRRISLVVKGDKRLRNSLDKIQKLYYPLANGKAVPLSNFITFVSKAGPIQIEHEHGYRKTIVQTNVENRDLVSFVEEAKALIANKVSLPAGYYLSFGGEFENQQRASARLAIIVPLSLFLVFILLFVSFGSLTQASIVLINVPLAVIQGSMKRLRPVLMTATITVFGLLPLLYASGPGSEIQRPLAIVVINGSISSLLLTLIVLPILYLRFGGRKGNV